LSFQSIQGLFTIHVVFLIIELDVHLHSKRFLLGGNALSSRIAYESYQQNDNKYLIPIVRCQSVIFHGSKAEFEIMLQAI
jgi:hypothetical protein